jgi:hypothetical protein
LHRQLYTELQTALGERYGHVLSAAHEIDFDQAIVELTESQPNAN